MRGSARDAASERCDATVGTYAVSHVPRCRTKRGVGDRTLTCVAMPPPAYAPSAAPSTLMRANDCFVHFPMRNDPPFSAAAPPTSRNVTVSPSSKPWGFSKSC